MPVTPFHFGPGALAHSVAPRLIGFRAFVVSQVIIDCETAWNMWTRQERLHTFFHSYLGVCVAMIIAGLALLAFNFFFDSLKVGESEEWYRRPFAFKSGAGGILFGGFSHVFIDSIMHADMLPFFPFNQLHPTHQIISTVDLHIYCLASLPLAAIILGARFVVRKYKQRPW